jgi:hypothetical protein
MVSKKERGFEYGQSLEQRYVNHRLSGGGLQRILRREFVHLMQMFPVCTQLPDNRKEVMSHVANNGSEIFISVGRLN